MAAAQTVHDSKKNLQRSFADLWFALLGCCLCFPTLLFPSPRFSVFLPLPLPSPTPSRGTAPAPLPPPSTPSLPLSLPRPLPPCRRASRAPAPRRALARRWRPRVAVCRRAGAPAAAVPAHATAQAGLAGGRRRGCLLRGLLMPIRVSSSCGPRNPSYLSSSLRHGS